MLRPTGGGDAQSFEVPIAGTISVRVEEKGTGAPASDVPGTGAQAALLGETSWGMFGPERA